MIRFEGVHKSYGSVHALRGVDITVNRGEFAVLIGPSGCGKTTALKMVNRLITPTKGRVLIDGYDVATLDEVELRRNIGYVIQEIGLFPHMTIAENIALVPKLKKWPKSRRDERVDELLHLVGLDPAEYRNRYPRHLSGGQRQRVGVARALASDPPIILMDEPFGATDPITRKQLQKELVRIKQQVQKTILFVTHDISEAFVLADTICLLRDGKVVQHATPEEMVRHPADDFVREFIGDEAVFHLFEYLKVGEIVDTPPVTVSENTPAEVVARSIQEAAADAALVVDERGALSGVITEKQVANGAIEAGKTLAKDIAEPTPRYVYEGELVRESFSRLLEESDSATNGRHSDNNSNGAKGFPNLLVVVDRERRPVGLIGYADLLRLIASVSGGASASTLTDATASSRADGGEGAKGISSAGARAQTRANASDGPREGARKDAGARQDAVDQAEAGTKDDSRASSSTRPSVHEKGARQA